MQAVPERVLVHWRNSESELHVEAERRRGDAEDGIRKRIVSEYIFLLYPRLFVIRTIVYTVPVTEG
jgi:hypothetical protein